MIQGGPAVQAPPFWTDVARQPAPIERLLDHCAAQVATQMSRDLRRRVDMLGAAIEATLECSPPSMHRIFTFHLPVPREHAKIQYVDCSHDHHDFDYSGILRHFVSSAAVTNRTAQIVVVTGRDSVLPAFDAPVTVVRLDLDPARLMFERAAVATALVTRPSLHDRDLALLDTDAFLNGALDQVFGIDFDVALTERPSEGFYMPVNEGVIFVKGRSHDRATTFFTALLATYERLIHDPVVVAYYGDITRWRGGQLALNAVSRYFGAVSAGTGGPHVISLPCATYNFWVEPHLVPQSDAWTGKAALHLKGDSKYHFAAFREAHLRILDKASPRPPSPMDAWDVAREHST